MEMLLDAMTRMSDTTMARNHSLDAAAGPLSLPHGTGGSSDALEAEDGFHSIEVGGASIRKRQRRASQPVATHQCRICQRSYARADRLSRHMKTHENARRYVCQRCQKSFNRADLLTRHMTTHTRNDEAEFYPNHTGVHRSDRAGQACIACATAKARCEDQKPCRRCKTKNITCQVTGQTSNQTSYEAQWQTITNQGLQNYPTRSANDNMDHTAEQQVIALRQHQQHTVPTDSAPLSETQSSALNVSTNPHIVSQVNQVTNHNEAVHHGVTDAILAQRMLEPPETYEMPSAAMDGNQLVFDNIMNEIMFTPNAPGFNNQFLDINFHDFTFPNEQLDTILEQTNHDEQTIIEASGQAPRPTRDVRAGYAAFTRSPWLWTPVPRDAVLGEGENLTLDEESISSVLTPKSTNLMPTVPSCGYPTITYSMRDKMYHLVSTMDRYSSRVPGFPSLDIINYVVEAFFVRHSYQIDNWIHIPSIMLSDIRPEFVLGLVVAGSTVISEPAIWKMGLVLQDVVRIKLGESWERKNSTTRDYQPMQGFLLALDAGLWSGFQRQMELAESFAQPLITMMRRSGMFGATADSQALVPHESDVGQILETKWKKWAQRETFKRLAIHLLLHDTRASIALQKCPLISVTEITISLPASRTLFIAGSASEWKSSFLKHKASLFTSHIRILEVMHDISILDDLHAEVDIDLCYTAAIHGFWCQIWAFQESRRFHAIDENRDSVHRLWLVTQQREVYQQLQAFEKHLLNTPASRSELLIIAELLLMILHISPDELQRFAGKYGEEAASQALVNLERWFNSENSRRAVWHAGQVFRWALLMPPAELRDFYAIAVYFASLALWTFGHLSRSRDSISGALESQDHSLAVLPEAASPFLIINGEENPGTRSFLNGRQTTLILRPVPTRLQSAGLEHQHDTFIRLDNPSAVLQIARDLYRNNFPFEGDALPPLVESMGNLIRDLGNLPDSRFSRCASPVDKVSISQEHLNASAAK